MRKRRGVFTIINPEKYYTYVLISWDYVVTSASETSNLLVTEFSNYTSLVGLVGTIIFLALIISIIVGSFYFSSKKV